MRHRQVQRSTSTTHPIRYAAACRLLRSLARKSAHLASWAIGLFAAEMHIQQRLFPKKGTGRLPAYQHPPPTSLEGPQPNEQISAIKKWKTKFGGDRDKKNMMRNNIRRTVL